MARRQNSLLVMILLSVLLTALGGGLFLWVAFPMYRRAAASQSWPAAEGRVVASRVETSRDNKNKTQYSAAVEYSYSIGEKNYNFNYIWISGSHASSSQSTAQAVVDRYPPGKQVQVYYDPKAPDFAVLEPGINATVYAILGVTGLFFVIGLGMGAASLLRILGVFGALMS